MALTAKELDEIEKRANASTQLVDAYSFAVLMDDTMIIRLTPKMVWAKV